MFSAMMSRSQELANLMNSYYEGIQTENQQMPQHNDLMSQLDAAEAAAVPADRTARPISRRRRLANSTPWGFPCPVEE